MKGFIKSNKEVILVAGLAIVALGVYEYAEAAGTAGGGTFGAVAGVGGVAILALLLL
jgi:hypothetical protein